MSDYNPTTPRSIPEVRAELDKVAAAIQTVLHRDGTAPNQMEADLDMNDNSILNVKVDITDDTSLVNKGYVDQQDAATLAAANAYTNGYTYSKSESDSRFINASGDTMTGPLVVPTPTQGNHAANADYVNAQIAGLEGAEGIVPLVSPRQQGDGVTVVFNSPATNQVPDNSLIVNIDGVTQRPFTDYTADAAGNVVFTSAPPLFSDIDVTLYEPANLQEAADFSQVTAEGSTKMRTLAEWTAQGLVYDTVEDMVNNGGAVIGALVQTKGYYEIGDGGGARYTVIAGNSGDGFGSHNIGYNTAVLNTSQTITTRMFGGIDGVSNASDALEAFNNYVFSDVPISSAAYVGNFDITRQFVIGSDTGTFAELTLHFDLYLDAQSFTSDDSAVVFERFRFKTSTGRIQVVCGANRVDMTGRNHLYGITVDDNERSVMPDMHVTGALRGGVRFIDDPKTSLSVVNFIKTTACGGTLDNTASGFSRTGTGNSNNQRESFTLGSAPLDMDVHDFIVINDYPHVVTEVSGSQVTVFPWVPNSSDGMAVKTITGFGCQTFGGDSSLLSIGKLDSINCGVNYRADSLYPANIGIVHSSLSGIGVSVGRLNNSANGGTIGNLYLESSTLFNFVESSTAIRGMSLLSCPETVGESAINISPNDGTELSYNPLYVNWANSEFGRFSRVGVKPYDASDSSSNMSVRFALDAIQSYQRNSGTVNFTFDEVVHRNTGLNQIEVLITGGGPTGAPTGTITVNAPSGWTINGQSTLTISGVSNPYKLVARYRVNDSNIILSRQDMTYVS